MFNALYVIKRWNLLAALLLSRPSGSSHSCDRVCSLVLECPVGKTDRGTRKMGFNNFPKETGVIF